MVEILPFQEDLSAPQLAAETLSMVQGLGRPSIVFEIVIKFLLKAGIVLYPFISFCPRDSAALPTPPVHTAHQTRQNTLSSLLPTLFSSHLSFAYLCSAMLQGKCIP